MNLITRRRAIAGLIAIATMVAGCGTTSSSSSPGANSGGQTSGGSVHFAVAGAFSGIQAAVGAPIIEGSKAAQVVINQAGGVLGHKLVLDPVDTKGDPADTVTPLTQEVAINHPEALIGPASLEIHGAQPVFDRYQIPDGWNGGSAEYDKNTDPYLWRCNASDSQEGVAMSAYAITKGYRKAAFLFTNIAASQAFAPIIQSSFDLLHGQIVAQESITPALSSYRTELTKIIAAKPDVIFSQLDPQTAATVFADFQQLGGLHIPIIGTDLMAGSDVITAVGPATDAQNVVMLQGSSELTGASAQFTAAYKQANNHAPEAGAGYAYDCTIDFALALTKAGSIKANGPTINKLMPVVSNSPGVKVNNYATAVKDIKAGMKINYEGVSGPLDFNQYHNVNGPWDVVQATGDAAGDVKVLETLQPSQIQKALAGQPI